MVIYVVCVCLVFVCACFIDMYLLGAQLDGCVSQSLDEFYKIVYGLHPPPAISVFWKNSHYHVIANRIFYQGFLINTIACRAEALASNWYVVISLIDVNNLLPYLLNT